MSYRSIPFCLYSTSTSTYSQLHILASAISKTVHEINDDQRQQIHLAAVLINNFVNHLIFKSESFLKEKKIDAAILQPLLAETIKKQSKIGSHKAQTGPAIRNDQSTIDKHINMSNDDTLTAIYKAMTDSIIKTYNKK